MTRVGLISNAASGHNRDRFERIRDRLAQSPGIAHIETASTRDIPAALKAFAEPGVDVLVINGGDGTAAAVLGQLFETDCFATLPVIALLPGGTANMTAGDVGIRGPLETAARRLCDWYDRGGVIPGRLPQRRLLRLRLAGQDTPRYGMFLGAGAIMQGTEYAHREIHSRGLRDDFSLALGTLRTLWGVYRDDPAFNQHVRIEIGLDDGPLEVHDTLILAVSTLERLAFGMRPFWGTGPGNLRLTLMRQGCTRFLLTFASIARGKPGANAVPESGYFSHNAASIKLCMSGALNLDGEILDVNGETLIDTSPGLAFLRL